MKLWKAIISYLVVAFFLFFEMGIQVSPSIMTDQLSTSLDLTSVGLGLMSGIYFCSYTAMQIPSGMLLDRCNPRHIITLSILICALGCFSFGLSTNIYLGSLSRLLMGVGSAFAFIAVLVVTSDLFQKKYFALITGITQMLAALGAMSGQVPLSYAVHSLGWRHTMFLLSVIGVGLAVSVWFVLNYKRQVIYCLNIEKKQQFKFSTILKNLQSWIVAIYACLLWAPMSGFASLWGVPFLTTLYGFSKHHAAFVSSLMWLGLAVVSPFLGWLSTAMKSRTWPLVMSSVLGVIAFGGLVLLHVSPLLAGILIFLSGAACSGQALSFTMVKEINSPHQQATAIAFNNMAVVISGAIFQPFLGFFLDDQEYTAYHFQSSMLVIFFSFLTSLLLAIFCIKDSYSSPKIVEK